MKKVIFELIRLEYQNSPEWISTLEVSHRFSSTISALEWAYEKYNTRNFEIDMDEGTISIDVKPKIDTTKELLWDEGLGEL